MKEAERKAVLAQIHEEELVELTRALVQIPSVVRADGSGDEGEVAQFVAAKLRELGLEVALEEVHPGRPNVIGLARGSGPGRTILFEAHSDVVTEGDPREWRFPPFGAEVAEGRIYGRGACDTKGNLAAAILAIAAILRAGVRFSEKIMLAVPVDEEGMMTGIKQLIKAGWADDVDGAIICEPEDNQLCLTQKGALRAVLTSTGKMSHGCMPLAGFNPIPPTAKILLRLQELERREIARLGYHRYLGFPSITPTVLRAPVAGEPQLNVMARDCQAWLDIRTVPGQDHKELKEALARLVAEVEEETKADLERGFEGEVRAALAEHERLPEGISYQARLEFIEERPWTETPKDEPLVKAVETAIRAVTGREPVYNGVPGATDGTFLWAWKGIPVVTIGAGERMVPHQRDEWVSIAQLVETTKIYTLSALEFLILKEG
ncbi:MAG: M20 family metallopeptidase [Candidatus Acetothermia bacterium]|nr:M20 family metallopeptidase [Candidatus Acetothermia bacterium]MDH7504820.1 M20 family metallopeptidase [Candidatus Acetothermia bacterium]